MLLWLVMSFIQLTFTSPCLCVGHQNSFLIIVITENLRDSFRKQITRTSHQYLCGQKGFLTLIHKLACTCALGILLCHWVLLVFQFFKMDFKWRYIMYHFICIFFSSLLGCWTHSNFLIIYEVLSIGIVIFIIFMNSSCYTIISSLIAFTTNCYDLRLSMKTRALFIAWFCKFFFNLEKMALTYCCFLFCLFPDIL